MHILLWGICLDLDLLLSLRAGAADDVHFLEREVPVEIRSLNRLFLDPIRSGFPNFAAPYFDRLPPPVGVANHLSPFVPDHLGADLAFCVLRAFDFSERLVEARQQKSGVSSPHRSEERRVGKECRSRWLRE